MKNAHHNFQEPEALSDSLTGYKLKGALCSLREEIQTLNLNTDNIDEAVTQTQKYSFFP